MILSALVLLLPFSANDLQVVNPHEIGGDSVFILLTIMQLGGKNNKYFYRPLLPWCFVHSRCPCLVAKQAVTNSNMILWMDN